MAERALFVSPFRLEMSLSLSLSPSLFLSLSLSLPHNQSYFSSLQLSLSLLSLSIATLRRTSPLREDDFWYLGEAMTSAHSHAMTRGISWMRWWGSSGVWMCVCECVCMNERLDTFMCDREKFAWVKGDFVWHHLIREGGKKTKAGWRWRCGQWVWSYSAKMWCGKVWRSFTHSISLNFLTYLSGIVICLNRVTIHPLDVKIHPLDVTIHPLDVNIHPTEQVNKVHLMRIWMIKKKFSLPLLLLLLPLPLSMKPPLLPPVRWGVNLHKLKHTHTHTHTYTHTHMNRSEGSCPSDDFPLYRWKATPDCQVSSVRRGRGRGSGSGRGSERGRGRRRRRGRENFFFIIQILIKCALMTCSVGWILTSSGWIVTSSGWIVTRLRQITISDK